MRTAGILRRHIRPCQYSVVTHAKWHRRERQKRAACQAHLCRRLPAWVLDIILEHFFGFVKKMEHGFCSGDFVCQDFGMPFPKIRWRNFTPCLLDKLEIENVLCAW